MFLSTLFSAEYWAAVRNGEAHLGFLWNLFLQDHQLLFVVGALGLSFLVLTLLVLYVLPRSTLGWGKGVGIALIAGLAFVLQISHSFIVPEMYANAGKGRANPSCPALVYGPDGKLVFVQTLIMHNGKPRAAMVAKKHQYLVEPTPYMGSYNGTPSVGLLVRNQDALGDAFPVFCSAPLAAGGQAWLDRINAYGSPVNGEVLQQVLTANWSQDFWKGIVGKKIKPSQLAELIALYMGNALLPASAEDLARAINLAVRDVLKPNHDRGVAELRKILLAVQQRIKDEHGIEFPIDWVSRQVDLGVEGQYELYIRSSLKVMTESIGLGIVYAPGSAGLSEDYVLGLVQEELVKSFSDVGLTFATAVTRNLDRLGVGNRQPVVTMPDEAPWYLIPEGEGEGERKSEAGAEGDSDAEGSQRKSKKAEDEQAEALRQKLLEVMKAQGLDAGTAQQQLDGQAGQLGNAGDADDNEGLGTPPGNGKSDSERFR